MKIRVRIEPPGGASFEREFESAEVVIGRAQNAGLVIPDTSVSRQHAKLAHRDGRWWIEDLGATNRTVLNNQQLSGPAGLEPGDQVRVGDTLVHVLGDTAGETRAGVRDSHTAEPVFLKTQSGVHGRAPAAGETADRQAARLGLLNDIHRALATPISLSSLLELILERCFEVLRPEEGVILLKNADGELRRAASRHGPGVKGEIFVSRRIVDEVAGKGQSALVLDAAMDERFSSSESIVMSGVKSVLAAPLTDAAGTIGMIALYSRASVRQFAQQDLDLLESLASAAALRVRNVALAEEAAARLVLEHELELAHEMQMAMLPRRLPERPEVAVAAALKPARSVGGDLYDFVIAGDRLWFIIGDVSGKGMAAALYMAVAKTLFRATVVGDVELPDVMGRINAELARDNDRMIFVTAFVGYLTLSTGVVVLGDAGHNPAVLLSAGGGLSQPELPKGVAFGVVDEFEYERGIVTLAPGDTLVFYTDGVNEAINPAGEQYGTDRLDRAIAGAAGQAPAALVASVLDNVDEFVADAPPEDDITLLAIQYRGLLT